ncbi:MAG: HmuY family protein [bacterium]|nr:HmuY family protein [bacterium]
MKYTLGLLLLVLLGTSCFKKDDAVTLPPGYTEISSCFMGTDADHYSKQMYFDLSTNKFYENQLQDWDICFQSSDDGFGVFINGGNGITVRKAELYNLNESKTNDVDNYILLQNELVDASNGNPDQSAMGDWKTYKKPSGTGDTIHGIYFIELGYITSRDRFKKLQIISVNDSFFNVKICALDSNNASIIKIPKNKTQNFTYYSFKNKGSIVNLAEPPKNEWDFVFTKYRTTIPNPPTTILYTLTGVLNNPNNVAVYMEKVVKFDDINANSISNLNFNTDRDAIGYDNWKTFDYINGAKGRYTVHPEITYIIRDTDNKFYKLRFLDFYDKADRTGNPKFEFIRIK